MRIKNAHFLLQLYRMNTTYQDLEPVHPALIPYIGSYRLIHGNKPVHAKEILPRPVATMMLDFQGLRFEGWRPA